MTKKNRLTSRPDVGRGTLNDKPCTRLCCGVKTPYATGRRNPLSLEYGNAFPAVESSLSNGFDSVHFPIAVGVIETQSLLRGHATVSSKQSPWVLFSSATLSL